MSWQTGTADSYKDALADLRTLATGAPGWTSERYTTGAEDEFIATAPVDAAMVVGIRTYSNAQVQRHGWEIAGMDSFASGNSFATQPGISPGRNDGAGNAIYGSYVPLCDRPMKYWYSVTTRRIVAILRVGNVYVGCYLGWGMPFDVASGYPDPKVVAGTTHDPVLRYSDPDVRMCGIINPIGSATAGQEGPMQLHNRAGSFVTVKNRNATDAGITSSTVTGTVCFPMGRIDFAGSAVNEDSWISTVGAGTAHALNMENVIPMSSASSTWPGTQRAILRRNPGGEVKRLPVILHDISTLHVQLDGVFWCSAAAGPNDPGLQPEDTLTQGGTTYHVFPLAGHGPDWNYLCVEEK